MRETPVSRLKQSAAQVALGATGVAAITVLCFPAHLDLTIPGFLYLLLVVFLSVTGGFASSAIVAVIAVACLEYFFIPPILAWNIDNPIDLVALMTFLVTSLVITRLASKSRLEARSAEERRKDMARLYQLALRLLSLEPELAAGVRSLRLFREIFGFRAACLFDGSSAKLQLDGEPRADLAERTHAAYIRARDDRDSEHNIDVRCLHIGGKLLGAVGFEGDLDSETTSGPLAMLAAVTLERARAYERASRTAAAIQAEILRSAILDALAHEFKTPLTAILTAAGTIKDAHGSHPDQREMAAVIENEAARLGRLTTRLLRMQRLDRHEVKPNLEAADLQAVVTSVVDQYRAQSEERAIELIPRDGAFPVSCDPELLGMALVQLLDNAFKYSRPGSVVKIEFGSENGCANIYVMNEGYPIRAEERERIFERFFRGSHAKHGSPGTGLGLYIARKIAHAHGGALAVDPTYSRDKGTRFRLSLPVSTPHRQHERKAS